MGNRVAIFGGGVAGLSAAHELVERGFQVSIYEKREICGGKARSLAVPDDPAKGYPGEHGFRFFPSFYRHLPDTMSRIPYGVGHVTDNLNEATRIWVTRAGQPRIELPAKYPQSPEDWLTALHFLLSGIGVPQDEVSFFLDRLLVLATSCQERRDSEYENITWWNFIGAATRSRAYQTLLAEGLTRSLVAMKAETGSTRSVGYILLQLLYGILSPTGFDRLLAGPTNDVWLTPWVTYLQFRGATIESGVEVAEFLAGAQGLTGVAIRQNGTTRTVSADYYIAALPVEVMQPLVTGSLKQYVPSLAGIQNIGTQWMNGIQFYLKTDVPLNHGHTLYANSPWALTSISQNQFWTVSPLTGYGDGSIGGVLSVDISDWTAKGSNGKTAMQCTSDEIAEETWAQLKEHLNVGGELLQDGNRVRYFLDPDVQFPNPTGVSFNAEPLMVNTTGSLQYRPDASTALPNFFLASDYVRTYTDLACMEAANEAARRAVNGILRQAGAPENVSVWPLAEPEFFQPMIALDRTKFQLGLPP
jgi:15-cis-phytoene desaturase